MLTWNDILKFSTPVLFVLLVVFSSFIIIYFMPSPLYDVKIYTNDGVLKEEYVINGWGINNLKNEDDDKRYLRTTNGTRIYVDPDENITVMEIENE